MACRHEATILSSGHTLCLSVDGTVFSFGTSNSKAHGQKESIVILPKRISSLIHIKYVATSSTHTACINYDGDLYTFGSDCGGSLGIGSGRNNDFGFNVRKSLVNTLDQTCVPQKVKVPPCRQVCCGSYSTFCLTEDNLLYSFGMNNYGQLGLGDNKNYSYPQLIKSLKDVEFIACGELHACCKTRNNEIYFWGLNILEMMKNLTTPKQCITS